jgi:hypothetical protein
MPCHLVADADLDLLLREPCTKRVDVDAQIVA